MQKNGKNMIIDRVIEYFMKLKWRLVVAWISNVSYSFDSSVFALLKSIKNLVALKVGDSTICTKKVRTISVDSLDLCLGSLYNESSRYCHRYIFVEGTLFY
jgi:hypothetical protein